MIPEAGDAFQGGLEDFWERQANAPAFEARFSVCGWPVRLSANRTHLLQIAALAEPFYSRAPLRDEPPWRIQIVVQEPLEDPGPAGDRLIPAIRYTGSGDWIHMDLGGWGNVFADLRQGWGVVILAPPLAADPDLVTRAIMHTLLTNFLTRHGHAMLHATGLVEGERLLLLMAPHNSGKSTSALRLTLNGPFRLFSDSQIYVTQTRQGSQLAGFPIGRGKLRKDMLPEFPQLRGLLSPEQVRDETKYVLDLRALDPALVLENVFYPKEVIWFLVRRSQQPKTRIRAARLVQVRESIEVNSLHEDSLAVWKNNLAQIEPLVEKARCYHLELGTDGEGVVGEVLRFWERIGGSGDDESRRKGEKGKGN